MKKTLFTFFLVFLLTPFYGQVATTDEYERLILADTLSGILIIYFINEHRLDINFNDHNQQKMMLEIDWSKYKDLKSIAINNYDSFHQITIPGLKKSGMREIWFTDSDIEQFHKHNLLPKKLKRIHIWEGKIAHGDTIFIPKIIEKYKRVENISIGCCELISFEKIELSKLKKLDTLILEGPIYEVNSLSKLKRLKYVGLWTDNPNDRINGWKTDSLRNVLNILLPYTKKESWCFPKDQQILLFNGKEKSIQNIVKGDTLLSYNFDRQCFAPNIVVNVIEHNEFNYPLCKIHSMDNLTASLNLKDFRNSNNVIATVNHPIISVNGSKIPIGDISTEEFVFHVYDNVIEKIHVERKQFYFERTKVYNLITEEKNYFVNGYLFADK